MQSYKIKMKNDELYNFSRRIIWLYLNQEMLGFIN
jgi:hypothetical protein